MIEKLCKAKQEGVKVTNNYLKIFIYFFKLVKEDEERKREQLNTDFKNKLIVELLKKVINSYLIHQIF